MINSIFKDANYQQEFDKYGYVKIPLLSKSDIEKLSSLFHLYHPTVEKNSFSASSFLQDKNLKLKIRDELFRIYQPYFENIFCDYTYFGSSFLYKTKGKDSSVSPHQDWTIVDEKKYVALNIWTPLTNTNSKNGTLYVVPKSQAQEMFVLRAPTIPFYFLQYFDAVLKCGIPMNANAGEAVILNQSLIHYSTPNLSDEIRIAITSGVKSKGAPMLFHHKNKNDEIIRYEMPEDFLLDFDDFLSDIYQPPSKGINGKVILYTTPSISKSQFLQKFGKERFSLWNKFREFWH
ncbi:MAG: phytanoyl-CoA dioxygenase family protein [Chitinophagaceae bacterium]|nr:phytanoyl-CoA dioxygenase family protein [Chitinophagaceae bacterium]